MKQNKSGHVTWHWCKLSALSKSPVTHFTFEQLTVHATFYDMSTANLKGSLQMITATDCPLLLECLGDVEFIVISNGRHSEHWSLNVALLQQLVHWPGHSQQRESC